MSKAIWEDHYRRAHARGHEKIRSLKGVACAFHSVIDGFIHLTPEILQPVLESQPELLDAARKGIEGKYPIEIHSPADFIAGMFYSLSRGSALQLMIRNEETYRWALSTFGPGELRLGGTSANMARSLAPLDIPVTLYANPLTKELANLVGDQKNISVITKKQSKYELMHPCDAADEEGIFAIHWVFDYSRDFEISVDGMHVAPKRANRYIPSWNPRNNQFHMSETFADGFMQRIHDYSHLFFSGFHILSERYPDGNTCEDVVKPLANYLRRVRSAAPNLRIHLEMASIASPKVRDSIIEYIIPYVSSIGLNETELPLLLENLGHTELAKSLREEGNAAAFLNGLFTFQRETDLRRIHFHNFGYYLCLETEPFVSPQDTRDALLFAAVMAAARAKNGLFSKPQDIDAGLQEEIGDVGMEQLSLLSEEMNLPSITSEGIAEVEGYTLTTVPTKLVKNPLFTVGLGDTISSGAFLTE